MAGQNVLVVEDSYLYADLLREALLGAGAAKVLAVPSVKSALAALEGRKFDFATLNIELNGEKCFPVADELAARSIPFVFVSADVARSLPSEHRDRSLLGKARLHEIVFAFATACRLLDGSPSTKPG
jgi:CheY-like chemotaxis protein